MGYNRKDHYFKKAKKENFAARSVYKLEEFDRRFKLLRPGMTVLDLGASPGSWSQYASEKIGPDGRILGIDLNPVELSLPNATFIQADLNKVDLLAEKRNAGIDSFFHIVLSDMAPKTTGIRITDQERSFELASLAFEIASKELEKNGRFVCKFFQSDHFHEFKKSLLSKFSRVEVVRPKSTRKASQEVFFVGLGFQ